MQWRILVGFVAGAALGYVGKSASVEPAPPVAHACEMAAVTQARPAPTRSVRPPAPRPVERPVEPAEVADADAAPDELADDDPPHDDAPALPGGELTGRVTDARGRPLYNVTVIVTGVVLDQAVSTDTDENGLYHLPGLRSAAYHVIFYYGDTMADRDVGVSELEPTALDVTLEQ